MTILYSNHCTLCNYLKELLDKQNIEYIENNNIDEMASLGIIRTPMLKVDGGELLNYKQSLEWLSGKR